MGSIINNNLFMISIDAAFVNSCQHQALIEKYVPTDMFTDYKQLFDATKRGKQTTENRLMIDIAAARHLYKLFESCLVSFV